MPLAPVGGRRYLARAMAAPRKRPVTKSGKPRARKGVKLKPTELVPPQLRLEAIPDELKELAGHVESEGGSVLAAYREPLGGNALLFAALPVDKVEPTSFQRDVSDAHVLKLTRAMDKTRRYLDPIIVVHEPDGFRTPNGGHRLTALKELGAKAILALVVPEREVAYQILALNIEKAHNLRDTLSEREARAQKLLELDDAVGAAVEKLKERGLTSPYLKAFVVARVNPLRFIKGEPPSFDDLLDTMTKRARGMDPARIKTEDLARSGGPPED